MRETLQYLSLADTQAKKLLLALLPQLLCGLAGDHSQWGGGDHRGILWKVWQVQSAISGGREPSSCRRQLHPTHLQEVHF